MSTNAGNATLDKASEAAWHSILRFAVSVTAAFVICEWLAWTPTFLAPVLGAALVANLPMRPPMKLAIVLVVVMTASALLAYVTASVFLGTPVVMLGLIALSMFLAFHTMARGKAKFPALLLLICLATIPVVVMVAPAYAGALPRALIRGIALALVLIELVYVLWPCVRPPVSAPVATPSLDLAFATAMVSTAIVVPLMLVYLLFGLTDALPVTVATVMLVANFDVQRSQLHALVMIVGNLVGGVLGLLLYGLLLTSPSLPFLTLMLFAVLLLFGQRIAGGGQTSAVALIAANTMLIILSSAIASGPGSITVWLTRLAQFVLAGAFAVGMMSLLWHRVRIKQ